MNSNDDGRIIVAKQKLSGQPEEAYLKFVMLCAEKIFSEVVYLDIFVLLKGYAVATYEFLFLSCCRSLGMLMLLSWLVEPSSLLKKLGYACVQA